MAEPNEIMPDLQILGEEEEEFEEDEYIFEGIDEFPSFLFDEPHFYHEIELLNNFVENISIKAESEANNIIRITIPTTILPLTIRASNDLLNDNILFQIQLELDDYKWNKQPLLLKIDDPDNNNYCNIPLILTASHNFFEPNYTPKQYYRSYSLIFHTDNSNADEETVDRKSVV